MYLTSDIRYPISNLFNIQYPISNIQYPISRVIRSMQSIPAQSTSKSRYLDQEAKYMNIVTYL
ncbi:hypothetical protein BCR41DRAFT_362521 [Lobosporangium transversale]|uniref:Uncharacterized protein n=1 Tax=Lobosporangium transversale TaxID=64571 RepID=A0A1Y2G9A3_9FUNG|nr:hypothetical protein BCR41DRAFT_362521 [Lobosporangium transversale]ORZ04693.1 hypothetical protein BCR41DRAFT_362521 [Lobosporangium transversale]|eukprot:XP_021876690.1 hypothetical protein BCR41DRAFT_362521 [Lobosporangium transversale]